MKKIIILLSVVLLAATSFANSSKSKNEEDLEMDEEVSSSWRYGLGLSLNALSKLTFGNVTISTDSNSYKFVLDYGNSQGLEFDIRKLPKNNWGFTGNLSYNFERSVTFLTISYSGGSIASDVSSPSKIQITELSANAAYRWDSFYLPIGINYSMVKFIPASGFSGSFSANGGIGWQAGLGFYTSDNFALELISKNTQVKLSSTSSGATTNYGTGTMNATHLMGKYFFD